MRIQKRFKIKGYKGGPLRRPYVKPFTMTQDELEYLEKKSESMQCAAVQFIRAKVFTKGWREELEELRNEAQAFRKAEASAA
jgi:hypothetical protein